MALIYVVEDDTNILEIEMMALRNSNYQVYGFSQASDLYKRMESILPDLVLLDIMLPGGSGLSLLREMARQKIRRNVIILSAKDSIEDKVQGLNLGADDYLPKPFAMAELIARVRALTRRGGAYIPDVLEMDGTSLDRDSFELRCGEKCQRLSRKEFQMMEMLFLNRGRLLSTEQFMSRIWGYESDAEINVVWVYISGLRKKLAQIGSTLQISAMRGRGYVLEASNG